MKRNMKQWVAENIHLGTKKPLPILSFPSVQLMNISVRELINDSGLQAEGMKRIADRVDSAASVSLMDLSLEAEAFGAKIHEAHCRRGIYPICDPLHALCLETTVIDQLPDTDAHQLNTGKRENR